MTRLVADYINDCQNTIYGTSYSTASGVTRHHSLRSNRYNHGSTTLPPATPRLERKNLGLNENKIENVVNKNIVFNFRRAVYL